MKIRTNPIFYKQDAETLMKSWDQSNSNLIQFLVANGNRKMRSDGCSFAGKCHSFFSEAFYLQEMQNV